MSCKHDRSLVSHCNRFRSISLQGQRTCLSKSRDRVCFVDHPLKLAGRAGQHGSLQVFDFLVTGLDGALTLGRPWTRAGRCHRPTGPRLNLQPPASMPSMSASLCYLCKRLLRRVPPGG